MLKKALTLLTVSLVLIAALTGCGGGGSQGSEPASADAALKITGSVSQETSWTEVELKGMDTVETEYTDKDGETETYTGVPLSALLDQAGVQSGATTLVFVAADDYTAESPLADVQACGNCIAGFQEGGGLRSVMPDFSGKLQVKDLVEIQVK
jgi:hypothetical protein